uniref:Uncharacterized protein n=1 Tax=Tetranychus urticae TaxID=32264 RepID=A0A158P5C9_TETUR
MNQFLDEPNLLSPELAPDLLVDHSSCITKYVQNIATTMISSQLIGEIIVIQIKARKFPLITASASSSPSSYLQSYDLTFD